jgi:lipopolysaccharide transport system permease protein
MVPADQGGREVTMLSDIPGEVPVIKIKPSKGWAPLNLRELWAYRELVYFFTWRDIKIRYKQTVLGAAWAVLQPLLAMLIFSIFFGRLAGMPSDDIPYPLFSYSGMVIWLFFANGVTNASNSMVESANTIKKVYFPRLAIPLGAILSGLVDFVLAFILLLGMMAYYGIWPTINVLWLPLLLLLALVTALGVGLWFSAMNVLFRDVKYATPFVIQAWLFATPIAYPSSLVPEPWNIIYGLNPMAGVVDGFRWALLGVDSKPGPMLAVSAVVSVIIFISGTFFFRRMEKTFADVI